MGILNEKTLIPVGLILSVASVGVCAYGVLTSEGRSDAAMVVQVQNLTKDVAKLEARQDKNDERWVRILEDLAAIKERLGVKDTNHKGG
jgi:hypothetical protein